MSRSDADQLLYAANIINNIRTKQIEGKEVFMQVIPDKSSAKFSGDIIASNSFGIEDGALIKVLDRECGRDATVETINKAFILGAIYLSRKGYTLSVRDLNVTDKVRAMTNEIVAEAERKTQQIIDDLNDGAVGLLPGKTLAESRETKIMQILNEVRTNIGTVIKAHFSPDTNISKMII